MRNKVGQILGVLTIALGAWAVTFAGVANASEGDYMYLYIAPVTATAGSTVTATVTLTVGASAGGSPIASEPVELQVFSGSACSGSAMGSSTQTLNASGQAQTTYATGAGGLAPGSYSVYSTYSGSETYAPVAVCFPFVVDQAVPTIFQTSQKRDLSASGGPSITDTATVVGDDPSGSVAFQFFSNATCSGSPALTETASLSNGTSSQTYTPPSAGVYGVTAAYSGDSNNLSVSSGCTESTIDQATPAVSTSLTGQGAAGTLAPGGGVTASATVSGGYKTSSGGGTITFAFFVSKANCQAATDALYTSGPASLASNSTATSGTYVPSMPGTYYVRTTYSGDTNNAPASDLCTKSFAVPAATTTTTSPSPTITAGPSPTPPVTTGNGDEPPGNDDGPHRAGSPSSPSILVLGDSYSAGNGAGEYTGPKECRRSKRNYAEDFAALLQTKLHQQPASVVDAACSGAVAANFWDKQGKQSPQLAAVSSKYNVIFLTIGGNDLYFHDIVEYCLVHKTAVGNDCLNNLDRATRLLADGTIKRAVRKVLTDIHQGAKPWSKASPTAKIVLLGYPYLEGDPNYTIIDRKEGNRSVAKTACGEREGQTNIVRVGYCLKQIEDLGDTIQQNLVNQLNARFETDAFLFVKTKALFAGTQPRFKGPNHELFAAKVNPNRWFIQPFVDAQSGVQGTIEALRYGDDVFYHPNPTGWEKEAQLLLATPGVPQRPSE